MRIAAVAAAVGATVVSGNAEISGCNDGPAVSDRAVVSWSMPDGPGNSGVVFDGCSDWSVRIIEGKAMLGVGTADCSMQGWRQDGRLTVRSHPVDVGWLSAGEVTHVAFEGLPRGPIGGIGAELQETHDGIRVADLVPDGPADRAGLRRGSVISSIDGVSAADLDIWDAVRQITGRPETGVVLAVRAGDADELLQIERAPIR